MTRKEVNHPMQSLYVEMPVKAGWLFNPSALILIACMFGFIIIISILYLALKNSPFKMPDNIPKLTFGIILPVGVSALTVFLIIMSNTNYNGHAVIANDTIVTHQSEIINVETVYQPYINFERAYITKLTTASGETVYAEKSEHLVRGNVIRYAEHSVYDTKIIGPADYVKDIFVVVSVIETP